MIKVFLDLRIVDAFVLFFLILRVFSDLQSFSIQVTGSFRLSNSPGILSSIIPLWDLRVQLLKYIWLLFFFLIFLIFVLFSFYLILHRRFPHFSFRIILLYGLVFTIPSRICMNLIWLFSWHIIDNKSRLCLCKLLNSLFAWFKLLFVYILQYFLHLPCFVFSVFNPLV